MSDHGCWFADPAVEGRGRCRAVTLSCRRQSGKAFVMGGQQVEIPSGDIWEKGVLGRGKCAQALRREHMLGVFGEPARRLGARLVRRGH